VLSLVFWTLTVIVSLKYVLLILRADNNGEGGLIAMLALASQAVKDRPEAAAPRAAGGGHLRHRDLLRRRRHHAGDLGAVGGRGPGGRRARRCTLGVPLTLLVLTALFAVQRFGTGGIGRFFGPITLVWFGVLVALGCRTSRRNPAGAGGAEPAARAGFIAAHRGIAFVALGAVVLCVTGGEALYADLGHFGKLPIRLAWFGLVMPALVVNYFGQGAMLLRTPSGQEPVLPDGADLGAPAAGGLATAATVIASQALITAAFSVTKQAIQLGYLPRLRILHTSVRDTGQIYVPFVNWGLFVCIVLAVVLFGPRQQPGLGLRHRGDDGHD
jgi:KUP system potassium uptake protein